MDHDEAGRLGLRSDRRARETFRCCREHAAASFFPRKKLAAACSRQRAYRKSFESLSSSEHIRSVIEGDITLVRVDMYVRKIF